MDMKRVGSAAGVLIVLGLIAWGLSLIPHSASPVVSDTSPVLGGTATSTTDYEYVENAPYYTIDIVYPRTTPVQDSQADLAARTDMEQAIAGDIAQFKQDGNFANLTPEDIQIQGLGPDRKYSLSYDYKAYQGSTTVSYVFTVVEDTLGAHPNTFFRTFTFSRQGTELSLADLFTSDSNYLTTLSKEAYDGIVAQLPDKVGSQPTPDMLDTVRIGTEPSPEALQFFYIDSTSSGGELVLLFPPYQVAAYAAGSFEVHIPLKDLSSILKPGMQ